MPEYQQFFENQSQKFTSTNILLLIFFVYAMLFISSFLLNFSKISVFIKDLIFFDRIIIKWSMNEIFL